MLTKEHANGITLERERERERERESIQFKNIATKVAAFCVQKIKEYSNVKEVSYTEQKNITSFFALKVRYNHDSKSCKYTQPYIHKNITKNT